MRYNKTLDHLILDSNPITEEGAKALYRVMADASSKCNISIEYCALTKYHFKFNYSVPDGTYSLDMEDACDYSILDELIEIASKNPGTTLTNVNLVIPGDGSKSQTISYNLEVEEINSEKKIWAVIDQSTRKPFHLPRIGILTLTMFKMKIVPRLDRALSDVSLKKILSVLRNQGSELESITALRLISQDIYLTTKQVQYMIDDLEVTREIGCGIMLIQTILCFVWIRIVDYENTWKFLLKNMPCVTDRYKFATKISFNIYRCNPINLGGYWTLDLGTVMHRTVFIQIANQHREEVILGKKSGRGDTSQKNNWCNFRNEENCGKPCTIDNINSDTLIQEKAAVQFDYVSTIRPPVNAKTMKEEEFEHFTESIDISVKRRTWKIQGIFSIIELQLACNDRYLYVHQVVSLLDCLHAEPTYQISLVSSLHNRIVDLENFEKILQCVDIKIARQFIHRLGWMNIWNPLKPSHIYSFDFTKYDHRYLCKLLLDLAPEEPGDTLLNEEGTTYSLQNLYENKARILDETSQRIANFAFAEIGEREAKPRYDLRKNLLKFTLLGTKPIRKEMFNVIDKYNELQKLNKLGIGDIESQYASFLKQKAERKERLASRNTSKTLVEGTSNKDTAMTPKS